MKEYHFDNINEFFEGLMNSKNANDRLMRVYRAYECECEAAKKAQEIESLYNSPRSGHIAHKISDDIYIVAEMNKGIIVGYFAHVDNKKSHTL